MKRQLFTIVCLLFSFALHAQSVYTCQYWFDFDDGQAVTASFNGDSWQSVIEAGSLPDGMHTLHFQLSDTSMVWSSPKSFLFYKLTPFTQSSDLLCHYWFDQDDADIQTSPLGNGLLPMNAAVLTEGMHTLHVIMEGNEYSSAQSFLFLKLAVEESSDELTYYYWFDEDHANLQTGTLSNGFLSMDVTGLEEGDHVMNVIIEGNEMTATRSFEFTKMLLSPCPYPDNLEAVLGYHSVTFSWTCPGDNFRLKYYNSVDSTPIVVDVTGHSYELVNPTLSTYYWEVQSVCSVVDTGYYVTGPSILVPNTYSITATVFPEEAGTVTGDGLYVELSEATVSAHPNEGYKFTRWTENGTVVSEEADYTFTVTSSRELVAEFCSLQSLGDFTYLSPADEYINRYPEVDFYWDSVPGADFYNLYCWQGEGNHPNTPMASGITTTSFHLEGLQHGVTYYWCVVAKNDCTERESAVRSLVCQLDPAMTVLPNDFIDFGEVEIGKSRTKTIAVSATALTEPISYTFLGGSFGGDATYFNITPAGNWNSLRGGSLKVTFTPANTQLYYSTAVRIASGAFADTIYCEGSLANRFVFTTNVEEEIYAANEEITITGHVEDVLGNAVSNLDIDVYLSVMGSRITLPTISNESGDYSVTYTPRYSEAGYYQVGSCATGSYSTTMHDSFDIPGMSRVSTDFIKWQPYLNESITGVLDIKNRSRIPLNNIHIEPVSLPDGCTIEFESIDLGPLEMGQLNYVVTGTELSPGSDWEEATFIISSDEGVSMNMTSYYYCSQGWGELYVYPPGVTTTMRRNESKMLSFQITNNGHDETGEITINVPEVDWMSVMSGSTLPSIAVGDTSTFTIQLFPGDNVSLTQYEGSIAVNCANGNGIAIPYVIEATTATTGALVVDVTDDYTFNTNGGFGPHLAGAQVTVTGYYSLDVVAQGLTDENGLFTVETLPEGYYVLDVQAPNHNEYNRGVIYIEAGQTNHQDIYLQFQAISYSWVVVPTEVEDEYELELVCNIKTNVPVPVVVIEGPSTFDTLAYGETLQYNITVSNYGLIDAYDAQITLPTIGEYVFTPLFDVIDTIHANSTVIIPCTMTRIFGDREAPCNKGINEVLTWYHCSNKAEWVRHEQNIKINIPWFHCDGFSLLVGNPQPPILPPVGPPHIPPVGPPPPYPPTPTPPPHITVLPTITPDFQLPEIASDSDGDCTPCWKVALSTAIHIATAYFKIPYVAGALDCLIYEAKADDFVNMLKASMMIASPIAGLAYQYITKDYIKFSSDLTKCVANVGLGVLGDKKGGTPFKIYDTANEIIEMGNRIGECITLNPNREDSQLGIVVEQFVKSGACFKSYMDELVNLFPEEEWLHEERLDLFLDNFTAVIDTISGIVMPQSTENLIAISELSVVNDTLVQRFVDRWNRSVMYWNEGFFKVEDLPQGFDCNFIQLDTMRFAPVQQAISMAESYGFSSVLEMFESSLDYLSGQSIEHSNDVCAKVSVKFKQTMAMTREAFEGTLKIYNGHTTDPMENIQVNMVIKNEEGVDCTNLFQINVSSLDQVTGIDGTGSLNAQQEGVIQLTMIPTIAAAPETPRVYSFGGSFSFLDPFSGEVVTYPLYPVELTVNPSPELHVDYFVQRHIISDDPLTEDTIEKTEPAEIAMMIRNVGMGDANNVYLESSQPEIIENQNGLLIQFDLVGSAMNGEQRPLGLTNIPFGIIPAQTAGIAEWYFTSSLMARVIQSTPHLIHNNSYGNPDLSLVTELHSHDLIKAVRAYSSLDDNIHDFLVNETPDFSHIPDMLYFSNGGTASVKRVIGASTAGTLSETNTTVLLNLNSVDAGWNYAYVEDPGQGQYELVCCTRDDGQIIPLDNVWITHVTMFDDDAPIHENILHILDTMSVGRNYCYTLMYAIESETPAVTTQSIILAKGWNWFSSYLECDDNSLFNLENELANNVNAAVVKSQSDGFVNLDENGWMGSMTDLVNEQMYQILVQQATEISMTGARVNPLNHPITLTSGWNWIGYLSPKTMSLNDALASLTPLENDVIKGQVSFSSYSEEEGWLGSLTTLQPGQGYIYLNTGTSDITLVYPNATRSIIAETSLPNYWSTDAHRFPTNLTMMVTLDENEFRLADGLYEIGAFVNGECRGSARIQYLESLGNYVAFLTVCGEEGEEVSFHLYDVTNNEVIASIAAEHITYQADAVHGSLKAPMKLHFRNTGVNEQHHEVSLFPNPTTGKLIVKALGMNRLTVTDVLGQVVYDTQVETDQMELNLSNCDSGLYMIHVNTDTFTVVRRFVLAK